MLKDLVLKNRSYRGYDERRKIEERELMDMVDHARLAPSSVNRQPLKYVLVYREEEVAMIQPLTHWAKALDIKLPHLGKNPTAFIIICQDRRIVESTNAYLRDVGIVAQTILLRATEMGLGGCMIGNFREDDIRNALNLEQYYYPHLILALGEPDEEIILTEVNVDGDVQYYRDENDHHYVPKRALQDIIIHKKRQ